MPASTVFRGIQEGIQRSEDNEFQRQQRSFNRGQQLLQLDDQRKGALFQDVRELKVRGENNDIAGMIDVLDQRIGFLNEDPNADPSQSVDLRNKLISGDFKGAMDDLSIAEQVGMTTNDRQGNPFLKSLTRAAPKSVQSSKILDDGTIIEVLKTGGRQVISPTGEILKGKEAKSAVESSRDQAFNRKKELARLEQTIKREESKENLLTDQQTEIQRGNIQRLGSLSNTATGRSSAVKKATKFKQALQKGEAFSGAGRVAASFIPGVFSSQGQFDEEFNAFSEVAARQQLKASGETRPTDADVKGMKQAMFGVGRDEAVNVQLLDDFIKDQLSQTQELDQLIDASKSGNLSGFTFTNTQQGADSVKRLEDMTIEELKALRNKGGQ